jgi:hypothetical protein
LLAVCFYTEIFILVLQDGDTEIFILVLHYTTSSDDDRIETHA